MMEECDFHYPPPSKKRLREFGNAVDSVTVDQSCGLRLHRGINWVPPLLPVPPQEKPPEMKKKLKLKIKFTGKSKNESNKFQKGEKIEVRSDEKGYEGSWYTATVVDFLHNGKYLVEYSTLKTDDLTEQLKEEVNVSDIRPCPPDVDRFCRFVTQQRVDVWFNDGWWEGVVSNVAHDFKYKVYFWTTNEELEFEHCYLRPHQDWIHGRWMLASLV